ncbi:hypothetical protein THS27_06735 [Thalassospira sp. MCCC 1A01428]|nr:hypothetical protein THS27_06735 [Thalassospira sp. MCCC 1A01428]
MVLCSFFSGLSILLKPPTFYPVIIGWRLVGLLLSRLLHALGISLVILARKSRANAEGRIRAGMPEMGTVDQMCAAGVDGQRFLPGDDISAASFWG